MNHLTDRGQLELQEGAVNAALNRWCDGLKQFDARSFVQLNYADESVLVPTLSNSPCFSLEDKVGYFTTFIAMGPTATLREKGLLMRPGCVIAAGIYDFNFADGSSAAARYSFCFGDFAGEWKIISHHSSALR